MMKQAFQHCGCEFHRHSWSRFWINGMARAHEMENNCQKFLSGSGRTGKKAAQRAGESEDRGRGHRCGLQSSAAEIWWSNMAPTASSLACPDSRCRNTKPYLEKQVCPVPSAVRKIVIRKTKKAAGIITASEAAPECDFMSWQKPSREKCPQCGSIFAGEGQQAGVLKEDCGYVRPAKERGKKEA